MNIILGIGTLLMIPKEDKIPMGFLELNGQKVERRHYPELFDLMDLNAPSMNLIDLSNQCLGTKIVVKVRHAEDIN